MKSFLLPGIHFLNRLKFSQKIFFAAAVFMLPIVAFALFSANKAYEEHGGVKKIEHALIYIGSVKALYRDIPLHRGMMHVKLLGNGTFDEEIKKARKAIVADIMAIDTLTHLYGDLFETHAPWTALKKRWEEMLPKMYTLSPAESFAFHTALIEDTAKLITVIGEHFRTSMSTVDLLESYMLKILAEDIVTVTEYISRIRDIGSGIAAKKSVSNAEKNDLRLLSSMIHVWHNILLNDLHTLEMHIYRAPKSAHAHAQKQQHILLDSKFENTTASIELFLMLLDQHILLPESISIEPAFFFKEATTVIDADFTLFDDISSVLSVHIKSHYDEFVGNVALAVVILLFMLYLLLYFNAAFYLSFMESLEKLKNGAKKVGSGSYGYLIDMQTNDEMLLLSDSFNTMSKDLLKHHTFLSSYKSAIDNSAIVSITDAQGIIIHANDKFHEITGFSKAETIGNTHKIITDPATTQERLDAQRTAIENRHVWHGITKNLKKNGDEFYTDTTIVPIVDEKGKVAEFISIRNEVTELIKKREQLISQLYTDQLTGLHNRLKLIEDINGLDDCCLILVNIDRYREINDYYGHSTGDEILMAFKGRLVKFSKPIHAAVYRLHADEFALLLTPECLVDSLHETVVRLHNTLSQELYSVKSGDFGLDVTLSAATKSADGHVEINNVLINADLALRSARKQKKDFMVFNTSISLKEEYENNLRWTHKLKEAIREDRIVPYFQPIINNETKKIEKYECLMRLVETDGTVISPMVFMKTAKKAKLYTKLTEIMINKSLAMFKDSDYEFSINISADDILDRSTAEFIKKSISDTPYAHRMIIEIVESEGIENFDEVSSFLQYAKTAGCKIAIDDFGTGYSNFEYLLKLNIDIIKIDGSLIKNIHMDTEAQKVVEAIIDFAHKLGIETVAEFVHSKEVQEKTENLRICHSQGYYFSEPKSHIA